MWRFILADILKTFFCWKSWIHHMLRTDGKSFRPIHPLPILTDTDSNRFLGLLTIPIPIPIFIYEYHTDTDTDFAKNTDIPIPIIPIIGLTLHGIHHLVSFPCACWLQEKIFTFYPLLHYSIFNSSLCCWLQTGVNHRIIFYQDKNTIFYKYSWKNP